MNLALLALWSSLPARAIIYGGNPTLTVHIERAEGDLDGGLASPQKVRLHACGGGYTDFAIGGTVDPVEGFSVPVVAGNWCGIVLFWEEPTTLWGENSSGPWEITVHDPAHGGALGSSPTVVPLYFTVEEGIIYGGNPTLVLSIQ